jgi:hypothetical protein
MLFYFCEAGGELTPPVSQRSVSFKKGQVSVFWGTRKSAYKKGAGRDGCVTHPDTALFDLPNIGPVLILRTLNLDKECYHG